MRLCITEYGSVFGWLAYCGMAGCQKRDRLTRIDARGTKTLSHSRVRVEFLLASSGLVLLHFTCIECVVLTIVNSVSDCVICLCCK